MSYFAQHQLESLLENELLEETQRLAYDRTTQETVIRSVRFSSPKKTLTKVKVLSGGAARVALAGMMLSAATSSRRTNQPPRHGFGRDAC